MVKSGICEKSDEEHMITISTCFDNEFTCNHGGCIDLDKKCDLEPDCEDKSDEAFCSNIVIPEGYRMVSQ